MDILNKIAYDFSPVEVGPAVTDENKKVALIQFGRNALYGLGVGSATGLITHLILSARNKKVEDKKKMSPTRKLMWSLGVGGATGIATFAVLSAIDNIRGTNYSHDYKVPDLKEGERPDFNIYISGSAGGPWQANTPEGVSDIHSTDNRYGENRTAHFSTFDTDYMHKYLKQIIAKYPDARIRIMGHSMGGTQAYKLAQWAADEGIPIDRLDTLDPVSRLFKFKGKPKTTKIWANYRPKEYKPFKSVVNPNTGKKELPYFPDFWAVIGGYHGALEGSNDVLVTHPDLGDHRNIRDVNLWYPTSPENLGTLPPVTLMQKALDNVILKDINLTQKGVK